MSVHYEACRNLHRTLDHIRDHGMESAVVVNPATRVDLLIDILPMVHHVLVMSVNPRLRRASVEIHPTFALDKYSQTQRASRGVQAEFSDRSRRRSRSRNHQIGSPSRSGTCLVAGSAVFGKGDGETATRELTLAALEAAEEAPKAVDKRETVGKGS